MAWSKRLQARSFNGEHGFVVIRADDAGALSLRIGVADRDGHEQFREVGLTVNQAMDVAAELEQAAAKAVMPPDAA